MLFDMSTKKSNQKIQVNVLLETRLFAQNDQTTAVDEFQEVEQIVPGIYLSENETCWTMDKLKSHGFTHIIDIDINLDLNHILDSRTTNNLSNQTLPPLDNNNDPSRKTVDGMDILSLNFGESYMTAVLPNCYKAVRFIDRALKSGGTILVFENKSYQKCVTIVVGFLMYRYNLKFSNAFEIIKKRLSYIELDKYYKTQLYEYEPILQVQRTQARGHSCSGELRRACLKRKKMSDDLHQMAVGNKTSDAEQQLYTNILPLIRQNLIIDKTTVTTNTTAVVDMEH